LRGRGGHGCVDLVRYDLDGKDHVESAQLTAIAVDHLTTQ
jgi:hypothetical protein